MLKVQINLPPSVKNKITWTWRQFCFYLNIDGKVVEGDGDLLIGNVQDADVFISDKFIQNIEQKRFDWKHYFDDLPLIRGKSGQQDWLGTCFYMLNCLQEFGDVRRDRLGRFLYSESYQHHFNCVEENLVWKYFERLYSELRQKLNLPPKNDKKSRFFLSHDIDNLFGSLKQDTFNAIKKFRPDWLVKIAVNEMSGRPTWFNIRDILELECQYGYQSTFFWLPVKGKGEDGLRNSDYKIQSNVVQKAMQQVENAGSENGIHKAASDLSFSKEIEEMGRIPIANRYHFLRFFPKEDFSKIENAGIKVDCSLGFAEVMGLRNNFALPFQPYNIYEDRPFQFVEVPLQIMDTSFRSYQKKSPKEAETMIGSFIEKHTKNALISVLWHNPYFTEMKFKGWRQVYEAILQKGNALNFQSIGPGEIYEHYLLEPRNA